MRFKVQLQILNYLLSLMKREITLLKGEVGEEVSIRVEFLDDRDYKDEKMEKYFLKKVLTLFSKCVILMLYKYKG